MKNLDSKVQQDQNPRSFSRFGERKDPKVREEYPDKIDGTLDKTLYTKEELDFMRGDWQGYD